MAYTLIIMGVEAIGEAKVEDVFVYVDLMLRSDNTSLISKDPSSLFNVLDL
jgi:hypothetical protein